MANRKLTVFIFGGFVTAVAAVFYPIFFHPLFHTDDYSKSGEMHLTVCFSHHLHITPVCVTDDALSISVKTARHSWYKMA